MSTYTQSGQAEGERNDNEITVTYSVSGNPTVLKVDADKAYDVAMVLIALGDEK